MAFQNGADHRMGVFGWKLGIMKIRSKLRFFNNMNVVLYTYVLIAVLGGLLEYLKGVKVLEGIDYTDHNNFMIFSSS